ncbi:hypothetical protein ACFLT2_03535 [Acidobacteriota bacterium]
MATKKHGWFKVCPEKWIFGSTREEMTPSERGVWVDFLALAAINDPPGQIDFFTERRLANTLNISVKLLRSTISKALDNGKVELYETPAEPNIERKKKKNSSTCVQTDAKSADLVTRQSKIGIQRRTIFICKWNDYQSEYLRQKPYRIKKLEDIEPEGDDEAGLQNINQEVVTRVTDRGEERRGEEKREEKRRGEDTKTDSNSLCEFDPEDPIQSKNINDGVKSIQSKFLARLKGLDGYPFDEYNDSAFVLYILDEFPGIDILAELEKKIAWWGDNPDALRKAVNPRGQLTDWFEKEHAFQLRRRG